MNPLSALSFTASPQLQPDLLRQAGQGGQPSAMPLAELQQLMPQNALAPLQTSGLAAPPREVLPLPAGGLAGSSGSSFSNLLGQMVQDVNARQAAAGDAVNGLLSGHNVSLHQAMIAMEEANVSFQLMVEMRNKLLESYQELMRMQI